MRTRSGRSLEAIAILERLAHDKPTVIEYQTDLAKSHHSFGKPAYRHRPTGRGSGAAPNSARDPRAVGPRQSYRHRVSERSGHKPPQYRQHAERHGAFGREPDGTPPALAIRERLAHDNPEITKYQNDVAESHALIGFLIARSGAGRRGIRIASAGGGNQEPACTTTNRVSPSIRVVWPRRTSTSASR